MLKTKLYTRNGSYVATVPVPPFDPPVDVINWGLRVFVRQPDGRYLEVGAYYTVPREDVLGPA